MNYFIHNSDITIDLSDNSVGLLANHSEDWKLTIVDTGLETMTAGRLKRVQKYIGNEPFLLTYGDGVIDLDISESIRVHNESKAKISMTVYKPVGRFGAVEIEPESGNVKSFMEKPDGQGNWINAGFFVCEPEVFDYLHEDADSVMFERQPLEDMVRDGLMHAYRHSGFWKPMDTLRDNIELEKLWASNKAPWKVW